MKKVIDRPIAQLVRDLDERGLLNRTLVILASEFSRDAVTEGKVGKEVKDQAINIPDIMQEPRHYGMHRHFTAAGSVLMFGGGVKRGFVYGKTADERPVHDHREPDAGRRPARDDLSRARHPARSRVRQRETSRLCHQGRQGQGRAIFAHALELQRSGQSSYPHFSASSSGVVAMTMTRRAFIGTGLVAPLILHGRRTRRARSRRCWARASSQYEAMHDWGELPPPSSGATPTTSSRTRRATFTCTTRCTRPARARTRSSSSIATGKFVRSWGKEFRGVAHGMWIRKEGRDEFLYLTVMPPTPACSRRPSCRRPSSRRR